MLRLPNRVAEAIWRGDELGRRATLVCGTGWAELDAELPGGGWPQQSLTEVLTAQPAVLEWRLLTPALRPLVAEGRQVVVIGPPRHPHLPGLHHEGLDERKFIWIQADLPAERLWTAEQLIKSNAAGAILAWLPKARAEQVRRLQVCAQACEAPVFLCRPEAARHEASAAPLRVHASVGLDWELNVHILKRRGHSHEQPISLPSIPGGLASVLTPRLRRPSRLIQEAANVVGSPTAAVRPRQHAAA
ncbi:MAG: translesion DNA synthesis-associated protein ImuA [Proteobacteria bacterium]|nr:translesion DNA synthesis-associated protein ImuA [Pseudomonadota bacterium]